MSINRRDFLKLMSLPTAACLPIPTPQTPDPSGVIWAHEYPTLQDAVNVATASYPPKVVYLVEGTYQVTELNLFHPTSGVCNAVSLVGVGSYGSIKIVGTGNGNVINIAGHFCHLENLVIDSQNRTSGHGIYCDIDLGNQPKTTQYGTTLKKVRILNQPDNGVHILNGEHVYMENVEMNTNGGVGLYAYKGINSTFVNVRCNGNGAGLKLTDAKNFTFINFEGLANAGLQADINGSGHSLVNVDIEQKGAGYGTGVRMAGEYHELSGFFYHLSTGIELVNAIYCDLKRLKFTNYGLTTTMSPVVLGAGCMYNEIHITKYNSPDAVKNLAAGIMGVNNNNIIYSDGQIV